MSTTVIVALAMRHTAAAQCSALREAADQPSAGRLLVKVPAFRHCMSIADALQVADTVRTVAAKRPTTAVLEGPDAWVGLGSYAIAASAGKCLLAHSWMMIGCHEVDATARHTVGAHLQSVRPAAVPYLAGRARHFVGPEALSVGLVDGVGPDALRGSMPAQLAGNSGALIRAASGAAQVQQGGAPAGGLVESIPFALRSKTEQAHAASSYAKKHGCTFVQAYQVLSGEGSDPVALAAQRYAIEHRCTVIEALHALRGLQAQQAA